MFVDAHLTSFFTTVIIFKVRRVVELHAEKVVVSIEHCKECPIESYFE